MEVTAEDSEIEFYKQANYSYNEFVAAYLSVAEDVSNKIHGIRSDLHQLRWWKKNELTLAVENFNLLKEDYLKAKTALVSLRTAYPQYYQM